MKKLVIAAALVCIAAVTEAATAQWNVANIYTPSPSNLSPNKKAGDTAMAAGTYTADQLLITFFYQDQTTMEWEKIAETSTLTSDGQTAKLDFWTADSAAYKALVDSSSVMFKADIVYNTADGKYEASAPIAKAKDLSSLADAAATVTISANGISWTYTAVPEPTSGLLLLLGVAGMALRRRRA